MRRSTIFLCGLSLQCVLFALCLGHAYHKRTTEAPAGLVRRDSVRRFGLTDLALFTEARYTRNLSQADRHTPFQDHPLSLEHYPTGSIAPPPPDLER